MKRKIIFGSLLAVFLMLMMPAMSAIEFNTVKDVNEREIKETLEELKKMPTVFCNAFSGVLGKILSAIAIPIVFAILTIFGSAITAVTSLALPLLNLFVKVVGLVYGNIFGITTNTFRALLVVAILLLF